MSRPKFFRNNSKTKLSQPDLSSIQDVKNLFNNRQVLSLMLLAQHFNISQFAEVEVSFFLQTVNCQVQILYLKNTAAATVTPHTTAFHNDTESVHIIIINTFV